MRLHQAIQQFLEEGKAQSTPPLIVLLGPTASGKTALSLKIAHEFNGEIVSADSRQIYKYMDIGTDKILPQQQEGIHHHMLDLVEPNQEFTLADYKRLAIKDINEIHKRQKLPILCGGTGLYLNAIIENYQIPQVPPQYDLRQKLFEHQKTHGPLSLYNMLKEKDPETAAHIHPNNTRYVVRALEINLAGNHQKQDQKGEQLFNIFSIGIDWPREKLYARIEKRVDLQIERGLLNEVKTLLMKGFDQKIPAMSSLGYLELITYINGQSTLEEAIEKIKQNTRNYAKRQITWFRRYKDIHWIKGEDLERDQDPELSVYQLAKEEP